MRKHDDGVPVLYFLTFIIYQNWRAGAYGLITVPKAN